MAPRDHAILSPSAAGRWCKCPASVAMCLDLPDESSPFALEGSVAHAVAESVLTGRPYKAPAGGEKIDPAPFYDQVKPYTDFVELRSVRDKTPLPPFPVRLIEQRLDASWLAPGCFGTSDAVIIANACIHIIDLKFGAGVKVSAKNNLQLAIYARSALEAFGPAMECPEKIFMHIVQPRLHHEDSWAVDVPDLIRITDALKAPAAEALREIDAHPEDLKFCPGAEQCRFCAARHSCAALAKYALTAAGVNMNFTDVNIDPEHLGELLEKIPAIEIWIKAIKDRAYNDLNSGRPVPGYKLVHGKAGNRAWKDVKFAEGLLHSFGLSDDQIYTKKIISPAQADKLYKAKALTPEQSLQLSNQVTRPEGALIVVPESDERAAASPGLSAADYPDESKKEG